MRTSTRLGALVGAAALSLALAACGTTANSASGMDNPTSTSSSASPSSAVDAVHNAADVSFTQQMLVHHQGAIAMAQLAPSRASNQQVKDLASRIEAAQTPEIDEMARWLKTWGEPSASTDNSMGSMGSDSMGMMTDEQMNQLKAASGTVFDRMFLQMMTAHHQGAIAMAKTEQANGSNPQATALARSIETSQTAEVTEMGQLLQNL